MKDLIETLELMVAQAKAYERALPPDNYPARAAAAALGELARQALEQARAADASGDIEEGEPSPFSPREAQVLGLAAEGKTNKEIAYSLGISERTVQFHLNSIFRKINVSSRTEAVALALRMGWLRD